MNTRPLLYQNKAANWLSRLKSLKKLLRFIFNFILRLSYSSYEHIVSIFHPTEIIEEIVELRLAYYSYEHVSVFYSKEQKIGNFFDFFPQKQRNGRECLETIKI